MQPAIEAQVLECDARKREEARGREERERRPGKCDPAPALFVFGTRFETRAEGQHEGDGRCEDALRRDVAPEHGEERRADGGGRPRAIQYFGQRHREERRDDAAGEPERPDRAQQRETGRGETEDRSTHATCATLDECERDERSERFEERAEGRSGGRERVRDDRAEPADGGRGRARGGERFHPERGRDAVAGEDARAVEMIERERGFVCGREDHRAHDAVAAWRHDTASLPGGTAFAILRTRLSLSRKKRSIVARMPIV